MLMPQTPLRELQNNEYNVEGHTSSIESENNEPCENQNYPNNRDNTPEYDTTGSINHEARDVQVVTQVPHSDEMSHDDAAPLLGNKNG